MRASVSWAKVILRHAADEWAGVELFLQRWAEFVSQQHHDRSSACEQVLA
ncbi:hypothetical protein [Halomicronema hongdechloris]|nr:hypothetical protein [Halomicronema hongdechloris]